VEGCWEEGENEVEKEGGGRSGVLNKSDSKHSVWSSSAEHAQYQEQNRVKDPIWLNISEHSSSKYPVSGLRRLTP
jgi:hypothetical protein